MEVKEVRVQLEKVVISRGGVWRRIAEMDRGSSAKLIKLAVICKCWAQTKQNTLCDFRIRQLDMIQSCDLLQ
ncbi:Hypothetical predicted protein [Octopus vulgaris]|uniref:Uncharacterized protein n=1 Tax=Octopus vulgaris TaxID=6645 RepID=A0AA36AYG9_OCTVU|nr:Hypothetical predicted protein [Octopus vulgaris]